MNKNHFYIFIIFSFILNFILKLFKIDSMPYSYDEIISVKDTLIDFGHIKHESEWDSNPPFYYYCLWIWEKIFGLSELGIRSFSVTFNSLTIVTLGFYLKKLIQTTPRIIMEGRDIGTVVAPNADLKIFITASAEVRAIRRYKQLLMAGKDCILSDVLDLLRSRDERDISREVAPLVPAADACIIDTTNLTTDQVVQKIKDIVSKSL